jgi:hypothetical protein
LGATRLAVATLTLEQFLKAELDEPTPLKVASMLDMIQMEHHALCQALALVPVVAAVSEEFVADPARVHAVLEQLAALLASDDTSANRLFATNRGLIVATLGPAARQLERQINSYDFPGALATARALAGS